MTKAIWRDVSKTSKAGLTFPEYRLKMPNGEAVLKLDKGAVFDEADHSQYIFCVRCFSANIVNESTGERDPDKAKKAAVDILRRRMQTTIAEYQEDLAALQNVVSSDRPQATPELTPATEPPKNEPAPAKRAEKTTAPKTSAKKAAAKKAAATKGSDSAAEPKPERKRGLTAAEKAVKTTSGKAEKKREDDTKGGTKKLTRKPRGRVAGKTDS